MKMKRSMLLCAALIVSLMMAIGGTLAYLQDTDEDVNVMTLGNVDIEQIELQRADGVGHTGLLEDGDLEAFEAGKPLFPAYPVNNATSDYTAEATDLLYWGPYVTADSDGQAGTGAGNGLWNDEKLKGAVDKMVFVKNVGTSDAYYRTVMAFECPEGVEFGQGPDKHLMMNINTNSRFTWEEIGYTEIEGVRYLLMVATYNEVLHPGEISRPSLLQVVMTHNATNETVALLGDTYEILVLTQGVQAQNFPDADTALNTAFGEITVDDHPWLDGEGAESVPVVTVATAEELKAALTAGSSTVVLTADIELDANTAITIPAGVTTTLNLAGHTLSGVSNDSGNNEMFLVKGEMTVTGGTITMEAENNQGWNAMTAIFDVTASGVLNISGATLENLGGTDMTFCVHLNNWGEVTLNVENSTLTASYCAVRVFNSGYDMNNVTIRNSTLHGNNRAFWVHNYIGDLDTKKHPDADVIARLNIDLINGTNTITNGTEEAPKNNPIRYGFGSQAIYYDALGNDVTIR